MINICRAIIISLLAITIYQPVQVQAQDQIQSGHSVSGLVIDSVTREPLPGVYITNGKIGAQTDGDGYFIIQNMPKGEHILTAMYFSDYPKATHKIYVDKNIDNVLFQLQPKSFNLGELVVTGTRTQKQLSEAPVLTTVISERDIQKAGSSSTLEALQDNIPGIVISPNAMGNNMRIKGLNSRYILFLIDGERMVSEGAGGNINFDQIDVNSIKRIEVINGAASALYGSNAVGAVINIITKDPIHKIEASANIVNESDNTWKTRIDLGSSLNKFSIKAGGFRNSSDGFGGDGDGPYSAKYEDYGADLKFGYKPTERIDLNVIGVCLQTKVYH